MVVLSSYDLWRNRFHADPAVVGRSILLNSRPHTIVGVAGPDLLPLPASLAGDPAQIYRPIGEPFGPGSRDGRHLETIVRLRSGVSIGAAPAELNFRSRQMDREHPKVDRDLNARSVSLHGDIARNLRTGLVALQAAVLMLVLIACANIANLLLAKSSARRRALDFALALPCRVGQLRPHYLRSEYSAGRGPRRSRPSRSCVRLCFVSSVRDVIRTRSRLPLERRAP